MQEAVLLECSECRRRNYQASRNKKNIKNRLEFRKFCPSCRKHTVHRETKR